MTWPSRLKRLFTYPAVLASEVQNFGSSGPGVRAVQEQLNRYGRRYKITVDITGTYDHQTQAAVRRFQLEALGMSSDGFVGPLTAKRLHLRLIE